MPFALKLSHSCKEAGAAWESLMISVQEERQLGSVNGSLSHKKKEEQCPYSLHKSLRHKKKDNSVLLCWRLGHSLKLITLVKLLQRSSTQASKSLVHGEEILITEPCKSAHVATAKAAKDAGVFLSYDRILSRFVEGLIMLIFLKWSNAVE
ncbi:uncharacterized protein LOC131237425 isoform X11 [Magnolia sinica]|uniref:uncharacterized protein LOC131237425 isoform X11 n=1 Tax=Magnolia sinica TaxID=86752 RepID=UPI00265AEAEE|nr:uncharacterized protein LOC131237425 isoform X11 [Magnolia sinica]